MKNRWFFIALFIGFIFGCWLGSFFSDSKNFFSAFIRNPMTTGSIMPSSPFLSEAITSKIQHQKDPIKILEVGAGTGSFTEKIIEKMKESDQFDVIEIDKELCQLLKNKFGFHKNVHIHQLSLLDWHPPYAYDFIISGLPHNAFSADFVGSILYHYKTLIKNNGILSYFEYMSPLFVKKLFLEKEQANGIADVAKIMKIFRHRYMIDQSVVLMNIPPAKVYYLKVDK